MAAPRVFTSIADAHHEGFEMYDHLTDAHVMRRSAGDRWEFAVVLKGPGARLRELPDSSHFNFGAPFKKSDLVDPDTEC